MDRILLGLHLLTECIGWIYFEEPPLSHSWRIMGTPGSSLSFGPLTSDTPLLPMRIAAMADRVWAQEARRAAAVRQGAAAARASADIAEVAEIGHKPSVSLSPEFERQKKGRVGET